MNSRERVGRPFLPTITIRYPHGRVSESDMEEDEWNSYHEPCGSSALKDDVRAHHRHIPDQYTAGWDKPNAKSTYQSDLRRRGGYLGPPDDGRDGYCAHHPRERSRSEVLVSDPIPSPRPPPESTGQRAKHLCRRAAFLAGAAVFFGVGSLDRRPVISAHNELPAKLPLSRDWKQSLHIHVTTRQGANDGCGGCMVLEELADSIQQLNISTSRGHVCPDHDDLARLSATGVNTFAFVYPETDNHTCAGDGNRVHVRWILARLGVVARRHLYQDWGEDDLVFHYASGCAVYPKMLPRSNILQVVTGPKANDLFDVSPATIFNRKDRNGTTWTLRKGNTIHPEINYIHSSLPGPHRELKRGGAFFEDCLLFLQSEYFVSYDPFTFYTYAAGMLGAISIVHPIANVSKKDWAEVSYVGEYLKEVGGDVPGVAYGWSAEEIEHANRTKGGLHEFMLNVRKWGVETTVERFARDCYRYGRGEREFESAMTVRKAFSTWYDEDGKINTTKAAIEHASLLGVVPDSLLIKVILF